MRRLGGRLVVAAIAALLAAACRRAPEPPPRPADDLQTVDVAPPPDVHVDTSLDVQEVRRVEELSGILPSDYPKDLPLPSGASLVDQGPRWVELLVGRAPAEVRPQLLQRVRAAGWQAEAAGNDAWTLRRGGVRARATLSARGPSTQIRVEY
jgi:hypothetical protein